MEAFNGGTLAKVPVFSNAELSQAESAQCLALVFEIAAPDS